MEREYIGIDLRKQFFQACAVNAPGVRQWESRFPRTDAGVTLLRAHGSAITAIAVEATGPTVVAMGARRSGDARDAAARRGRALGAPAGRAESGVKARVALARRLCDDIVARWPQGA